MTDTVRAYTALVRHFAEAIDSGIHKAPSPSPLNANKLAAGEAALTVAERDRIINDAADFFRVNRPALRRALALCRSFAD